MWNWNVPSALKAYIDNIIIPGVLAPGMNVLADKKITFCVSQGGSYGVDSGKGGWDYLTGYLVMVAQALGATDVELIFAEYGLAGIVPEMATLVDKKEASIAAANAKAVERGSQ
jgi:FMN-dependent NADH-azoreductase